MQALHEDIIGNTTVRGVAGFIAKHLLDAYVCVVEFQSVEDIVSALVKRGCVDLTSSIDTPAHNSFPVAGGGFCDLYRGKSSDGKTIAIKVLRVFESMEVDTRGRIQKHTAREIYRWSKLKHRNIVPLLGFTLFHGERISMVSEWMENGDLKSYIQRTHKLNVAIDKIRLCADVCEGLGHIHASGMVHGDLKSANVLVSLDGVAMIADFGSAQLYDSTLQFLDTTGAPFSYRWAAPELLSGGKVSRPTDVYAYGMTVLEVLTGELPFSTSSYYEIRDLVCRGETPTRPNLGINDDLWKLLLSCWSLNPTERPSAVALSEFMLDQAANSHSSLQQNDTLQTSLELHSNEKAQTTSNNYTRRGAPSNNAFASRTNLRTGVDTDTSGTPPSEQIRSGAVRNNRPPQPQDTGAALIGASLIGLSVCASSGSRRDPQLSQGKAQLFAAPYLTPSKSLPRYVVFQLSDTHYGWTGALEHWRKLTGARIEWHVIGPPGSCEATPTVWCILGESPNASTQASLQRPSSSPEGAAMKARQATREMLASRNQNVIYGHGTTALKDFHCAIQYEEQGTGRGRYIATNIKYAYSLNEWVAVECRGRGFSPAHARSDSARKLIESQRYCMVPLWVADVE